MGQVLVLGVVAGGIYALFALATVLVYRGTRVLHFAQGELGTLGLFLAATLVNEHDTPWFLAALAAVVLTTGIGVGFERVVVRRMGDATKVSIAVATVGLSLFLLSGELLRIGASPRSLPGAIDGVGPRIAGVVVSPTQILGLVVALGAGVGLSVWLRRTDFGLGVLAVAQDPSAARLVGVPINRVAAFVWGTGAALSTVACLLVAPSLGAFAPGAFGRLFLFGLTAAIVGGLTSLPGAFAGGLIVGLVEAGAGRIFADSSLPGVKTLAVFLLLLVTLTLRPNGLFGTKDPRRI